MYWEASALQMECSEAESYRSRGHREIIVSCPSCLAQLLASLADTFRRLVEVEIKAQEPRMARRTGKSKHSTMTGLNVVLYFLDAMMDTCFFAVWQNSGSEGLTL